jgi:primosomal protein N' (replication factor Y)
MLTEGQRLTARAPLQALILVFLSKNPGPHPKAHLLKHTASSSDALRRLVKKGWVVEERQRDVDRFAADHGLEELAALSGQVNENLHPDQIAALEALGTEPGSGKFRTTLLHGVTGSGKTEVYLRALREVLGRGQRGLVLVPEISLTPQTVLRFRQGLPGEPVAVLHSMLTPSERTREWRHIQEGRAKLVIGVRSSVFAPIPDLGLIVVDEEHDASYKQESSPRYHARDVAIVRARMLDIPIVLGTATPSLESFHNARSGKYELVEMPRRVTSHDLPVVTIVPLKPEYYRPDGSGLITSELDRLIRDRLKRKEQVLLFLNRRGFATYLHCTRCGFVLKCQECDVTLTFHRSQNAVRCHYCGHYRAIPTDCPECNLPGIRRSGVGTEKVAAELARRYAEARIARLDRDTAKSPGALRATIGGFARGEYDMLVGTQMVAKGHDFPQVTLVGVINGDTGLHFPDFRSAERTFQLITQVAGRAGRGANAGRVIVQSFFPDHFAIQCAATSDFAQFSRKELEFRKTLGYPPFGRLVKILFQGPSEDRVSEEAKAVAGILAQGQPGCRVLGPAPSPIARIQGKFRFQILLKSASTQQLHALLGRLEKERQGRKGAVERTIDVDPNSML